MVCGGWGGVGQLARFLCFSGWHPPARSMDWSAAGTNDHSGEEAVVFGVVIIDHHS